MSQAKSEILIPASQIGCVWTLVLHLAWQLTAQFQPSRIACTELSYWPEVKAWCLFWVCILSWVCIWSSRFPCIFVVVVQLLNHVWFFAAPWTAAHQAFLSFTISWSLLKLMSIESVMPSNPLVLFWELIRVLVSSVEACSIWLFLSVYCCSVILCLGDFHFFCIHF